MDRRSKSKKAGYVLGDEAPDSFVAAIADEILTPENLNLLVPVSMFIVPPNPTLPTEIFALIRIRAQLPSYHRVGRMLWFHFSGCASFREAGENVDTNLYSCISVGFTQEYDDAL